MTGWERGLADWWRDEVSRDAGYARDVDPLADELLAGARPPLLDLGCGEGRLLGRWGATVGVDLSADLLRGVLGPVAVANLDSLPFADASFGAAYSILVFEHLDDIAPVFAEAARVVRPGGVLAVVSNHPLFTAPDSAPIVDDDGEVLWRLGGYFDRGHTDEPAGDDSVRFHHHRLGDLIEMAAAAGWMVTRLVERPGGDPEDPLMAAQASIPRLLGLQWTLISQHAEGRAE